MTALQIIALPITLPLALITGMLLGIAKTWPLWLMFAIGWFIAPLVFG